MDLLRLLSSHVLNTQYRSLPPPVLSAAKRSLLDTLGTLLAGSNLPEYQGLLDLVREWGGKEESTILPWGTKVPLPHAILVNATLARARDFDEVHPVSGIHPSASIIPTALAFGEAMGGISGQEFLAAVALGIDVLCRLRLPDNQTAGLNGWSSDTYNPFGAAFTAGRILGLSNKEMGDALGFAYAQAAGGYQIFQGAGYSAVHQGLGARAGAFAALLARKGMNGPVDALEGKYGLYHLYLKGNYNPQKALAGLGEEFQGTQLSLKAYPCCLFTHGPIDAARELMEKYRLALDSIARLTVKTNRSGYNLCGVPLEEKRRPATRRGAMFSIPYTLATSLVRGKVFFDDFLEEKIREEKVLEMASRITVEVDPVLDGLGTSASPCIVEAVLTGGQRYSARVDYIKGHPRNPLDFDGCVAKFKKCASFSAKASTPARLEELVQLVNHLEEVEDVRSLVKLVI